MLTNAHGLTIGVASYREFPPLPPAVEQDAGDVRDALVDKNYCAYGGDVRMLLNAEASKEAILGELRRLVERCDPTSHAFFYFSGHGASIAGVGEFLVPHDATLDASGRINPATGISARELTDILDTLPGQQTIIILDCCHADGVGGATKKGLLWWKPLSADYYGQLAASSGRLILASCGANETSLILAGQRNSLFTTWLLRGLHGGVGGTDGYIKVLDLVDYLVSKVSGERPDQNPTYRVSGRRNFPIALHLGGVKSAPPLSPPPGDRYSTASAIQVLVMLIEQDRVVRDHATAVRAELESMTVQIDRITVYKELHDLLQQLQMHYGQIESACGPPAFDDAQLDVLAGLKMRVDDCADQLTVLAALAEFGGDEAVGATARILRLVALTGEALEARDPIRLARAGRQMHSQLSILTSRLNDRLVERAAALRLQPLARALTQVQQRFNAAVVAGGQFRDLAHSAAAVEALELELRRRLFVHERMQDIVNEIRRLEGALDHGTEIAAAWPELKESTAAVLTANTPWTRRLAAQVAAVDGAVAAGGMDVPTMFRKYCLAVKLAFNQVDGELRVFCGRLQEEIRKPLAPVLELLVLS